MMKKILFLLIILASFGLEGIKAQTCVPDNQYTLPGIYPDTLVGLPCAQTTVLYQTTLTVIAPEDSIYDLGPPLGTINAIIDSIVVQDNSAPADGIAVNGLPSGFAYVCNPPSCSFPGGSTGCVLLIGTAGAGTAGTYNIQVEVDAYVNQLVGFGNPPVNMDDVDQYSIVISEVAPPTPTVTSTDDTQGAPPCDGTATVSGGITYLWDNAAGGGTAATAGNLCAGTYNVAAFDVNGCAGVASVTVGPLAGIYTPKPGISVTNNSPNPFSDKTGISFDLQEPGTVSFVVIDMVGKVVYSESVLGTSGTNTIEFDASGITPGVYMYNLLSGVHSVSGKMSVNK